MIVAFIEESRRIKHKAKIPLKAKLNKMLLKYILTKLKVNLLIESGKCHLDTNINLRLEDIIKWVHKVHSEEKEWKPWNQLIKL